MDFPKDKDISQNQQEPNAFQNNSNDQNTPMIQEPFNNSFETKKLEIPFSVKICNILFFIFVIISSLTYSLSAIPIIRVFAPIFSIIELLLLLYYENNKIVIIKDEFQNKIYLQVINYLFFITRIFNFYLGNIYFNMVYYYNKYIFLIVNNCKIGPENDFNTLFKYIFMKI